MRADLCGEAILPEVASSSLHDDMRCCAQRDRGAPFRQLVSAKANGSLNESCSYFFVSLEVYNKCISNKTIDTALPIVAALFVLLSAMWKPNTTLAVSLGALILLSIYYFLKK